MIPTVQVYDLRFGGELMTINDADFDPAIHRREADGPWPKGKAAPAADAPEQEDGEAAAPAKKAKK